MQKTLAFGVVAALMLSVVGGLVPVASAVPFNQLVCSPSAQNVAYGQWVAFSAYYTYGGTPSSLTWSAPGGSPSSGTGTSFSTQFWTSHSSETKYVTVTDGYQSATCTVYLTGVPSPTPTPTLSISPTGQTITSGQSITFTAWGGTGAFSWSAPNGSPSSGWGSTFTTAFSNLGPNAQFQEVKVTSGNNAVYAWVTVLPPTPTPQGNVTVSHSVYNATRGGSDGSWVSAQNGDRLRFTVRITTANQYAEDVHVRDWLPQYMTYVAGSTRLDGAWYQDGVATGASTNSLALGTLSPYRTYILTFEATLDGASNTTLTNSVNVHVRGYTDRTLTSTIAVTGSAYTPTPTPTAGTEALSLTLRGRNVTRGQTGERATVGALGGDTLDLIVRVKSNTSQYLYNVSVVNSLPVGIAYIPGSTTLNGTVTGDGVTSSGLPIGTLAPWQETTVKFSVRVDGSYVPTVGRATVTDIAQARADGVGAVSGTLALTLGTLKVVSSAAGVKTGPMDTLALALVLAFMATGGYALYTRTGFFNRRMALAEIRAHAHKPLNFSR